MLKLFKLEAVDGAGRVVQSVVYRYGEREPHLAPTFGSCTIVRTAPSSPKCDPAA